MNYYKQIEDGYIIGIGTNGNDTVEDITAEEYNTIRETIHTKPADPDGYTYMLRADTLEWELLELPPVPQEDPTDEDIINTLFGGGVE